MSKGYRSCLVAAKRGKSRGEISNAKRREKGHLDLPLDLIPFLETKPLPCLLETKPPLFFFPRTFYPRSSKSKSKKKKKPTLLQ